MRIALILLCLCSVASGQDYSFVKLVNYDFATTQDVKRIEAKVDAVAAQVGQIAAKVDALDAVLNSGARPVPSVALGRDRIVVITDGDPVIDEKLDKAFSAMKNTSPAWRIGPESSNQVQVLRRGDAGIVLSEIGADPYVELPLIARFEGGKIVRRWMRGCTTPLDAWTFGWLQTGEDNRPVSIEPEKATVARSGKYPLTGGWWSVEGHWNPSKAFIIDHLLTGSQHRGRFTRPWLESLSYAEVQSVHTDDHTGRLKTAYLNGKPTPSKPVRSDTTLPQASTRLSFNSSCPNGQCPLSRSRPAVIQPRRRFLNVLGN